MNKSQRGFTLVELITTIIVIGILAAVAAPRFMGRSEFDALGFHDGVLAALRYAQKSAVAQRHMVCVQFTANQVQLKMSVSALCDTPLTGPDGQAPYTVKAQAGAGFSSLPAELRFFASGRASADRDIRIQDRPAPIRVVAATGYVY